LILKMNIFHNFDKSINGHMYFHAGTAGLRNSHLRNNSTVIRILMKFSQRVHTSLKTYK
jgi:hypothetical protein